MEYIKSLKTFLVPYDHLFLSIFRIAVKQEHIYYQLLYLKQRLKIFIAIYY